MQRDLLSHWHEAAPVHESSGQEGRRADGGVSEEGGQDGQFAW